MAESKVPDVPLLGNPNVFLGKTVSSFAKVIEPLSRWTNFVSIGVLAAMMLFTAVDVFLRYIFNSPIPGDMELTQFMMSVVVAASIGYCAFKKGHIIVDTIFNKLSPKPRAIFNIFHYLIGAILLGLICWRTTLEGIAIQGRNLTSPVLLIPIFPFYWIAAFGCAVLCLAWLFSAIEAFSQAMAPSARTMVSQPQGGER